MSRAASGRGGDHEVSNRIPNAFPASYFERSQTPLTCLVFLFPLLVAYEAGTRLYTSDVAHHTETRIRAFYMLQQFFHLFGANGRYLPAFAVAAILLCWHIARKDCWDLDLFTPMGMAAESIALSIPLFVLNALSARYIPLSTPVSQWPASAVLSVGAGIYEELVFRLIGMTVLSILLMDVLKMRKGYALLLIVCLSALLFSAYHYLGAESFTLRKFAFRTAAGIYFGVIFFTRGFGITAGSHAAYDLLLFALTP